MSYSILDVKADLTGIAHGTTINQIQNLYGLIDRAAKQLLLDVDPQETIRIIQLPQVFQNVYDYASPVDLKGTKVIDIRPQVVPRYQDDIAIQTYNQTFDRTKAWTYGNEFTVNFNTAVKTLRISKNLSVNAPIIINNADGITTNGTWTTGGGATNLTTNNINYVGGGGALQFDLSAGQSTGYIVNTTSGSVDLSALLNQGYLFLYASLPTGADVTNINLQWGSDSSNYYSQNATQTQQGTAFQNGYNLISFPWFGATVTGTPVDTAITYLKVTITYNSTLQTGVLINNIVAALGNQQEIEYYSKYLFRDNITGAFQENVTDDSNLINLDTESYNLLFNQIGFMLTQQMQGLDALFYDASFFQSQYDLGIERYVAQYKSQVQKPQQNYYVIPNKNQTNFLSRRYY